MDIEDQFDHLMRRGRRDDLHMAILQYVNERKYKGASDETIRNEINKIVERAMRVMR